MDLFDTANTTPTEHCWQVHDARDGRVLLSSNRSDIKYATCLSSNLVVYDPLHGSHVQIPPIPNDIVGVACTCKARREQHRRCSCCCHCRCEFEPFLVPATAFAGDKDDDDLSFQVMCIVLSTHSDVLETFVYSSVTRKWRGVASLSKADYEPLRYCFSFMTRRYAHGCFYWVCLHEEGMLVLDMNEMKFSVVPVPPGTKNDKKVVVAAAAEQDGVVVLVLRGNKLHLYRKAGSANDCWQWRHDDAVTITLLDSYKWFFCGAADDSDQGYALLQGIPQYEFEAWRRYHEKTRPKLNAHYFTVGLQTLLVELLCVTKCNIVPVFLYASFPPPFAPPSL